MTTDPTQVNKDGHFKTILWKETTSIFCWECLAGQQEVDIIQIGMGIVGIS